MALATLSVDLVAKLANLEAGMSKAVRLAEKDAARIEAAFGRLKSIGSTIAGALGGAFAAGTFAAFFRETANGIDALNDLKDATGASIENLSALEDVALRTGTSFEGMASTLVKFNKVLKDAKVDNEAGRVLKSLGLDAERLKQLDPAEALRRTAVALSQYANDGEKARAVQALFGKSIQEAAPLLNELAQQGKLNATVTTEQAVAAEKFNQQLAGLRKNALDASRAIVSDMIPALSRFFEQVNRNAQAGGFFASLAEELRANMLGDRVRVLTAQIEDLQKFLDNPFASGTRDQRVERLKQLREELGNVTRQAAASAERLKQFANVAKPLPEANPFEAFSGDAVPASLNVPGEATTKKISEFQRYIEKLQEAQIAARDLTEVEKARILIADGELGKLTRSQEQRVLKMAEALDELRRKTALNTPAESFRASEIGQTDAVNAAQAAAALEELNEQQERLRSLLAAPGAEIKSQREDMLLLAAAFNEGRISAEQFSDAATKRLELIAPTLDKVSTFADEAGRNIQDALGDTLQRTLAGDFDSIGDLWKNMLTRMIAEATAARLGEALLGNFAKTGQIGGGIGSLLQFFGLFGKGGVFGSGGVTPFANGGVVNSPTLFKFANGAGLMGEAGPEAILPLRRGKDGKLGVASEGGGGNFTINVAAGVQRNELMTALQMMRDSIRSEFNVKLRGLGLA